MSGFKKAERKQVKLKLAITGPSGSGKTFSAMRMAKGMGDKIAVVDTENGSASLYSDQFGFDVIEIRPPFTTEKYLAAIKDAEKEKYDVLIIDSLTHAWAGEGGLLEQKEQLDARGKGNGYTNWATITKKQEAFKSEILQANIHVISTIRSKQDYVLQDKDGKQVPKKVGMAPIQREGLEYEFSTVFDVAMNHEAEASKDRTGLFDGKIFKITEETGKTLISWLSTAKELPPVPKSQGPIPQPNAGNGAIIVGANVHTSVTPATPTTKPRYSSKGLKEGAISEAQVKRLFAIANSSVWLEMDLRAYIETRLGVDSTKDIHWRDYEDLCNAITSFTFTEAMEALGVDVKPKDREPGEDE